MNRKLPTDAFEYYFGLGTARSYVAVAEKYGVAKQTVTTAAKREDWQRRVTDRERQVQAGVEKKAVESIEAMRERHMRLLKAIQGKAIQALQQLPLDTAFQAVRALALTIEQERVIRGEPGDRTAVDIEAVIRREYETLLLRPGQKEDWGDGK